MEWRDKARNHNKIQCNYISSLRAVEFHITIVINFFKRWRVVFQGLHNLAALSVSRNNIGLVNFNSRFLDLPSGVTAI